jgi:hypothetical protein
MHRKDLFNIDGSFERCIDLKLKFSAWACIEKNEGSRHEVTGKRIFTDHWV